VSAALAFSTTNSPPELITEKDIFRERCEARAILVEACAMDLHSAVDGLQEAAWRTGLAKQIGQDAVQ